MIKDKLNPRLVLTIFILLNIIVGLIITTDFGASTDEFPEFRRANLALTLLFGRVETDPVIEYSNVNQVQYYGTSASMFAIGTEILLQPILQTVPKAVSHFVYFLFFQIAILSIYFLAAKFVTEWIALLSAVIFGSQPLLFGHAFINSKDTPLMSLFLATVTVGFYMVDHLKQQEIAPSEDQSDLTVQKQRRLLILLTAAAATQLLIGQLAPLLEWLVTYAYTAPETNLIRRLFQLFTTYGSLEGYRILAAQFAYSSYKWIVLVFLLTLLFFGYQVWRHKLFYRWMDLSVLLAGTVWGFACSTRVLALAAGGMVGLYGLIRLGKKGIPYLVSYSVSAAAVSYITWPYLWIFGPKGFLNAFGAFSDFSYWKGRVLFEGQFYNYNEIPARYLPKLMMLQFTEPAVLLALAGFLLSLYLIYRKKLDWLKMSLLYAWFALPLLYTILAGTVTYHNFRQYLFTIPPLFIFVAVALQEGLGRLKNKTWFSLAVVITLLPGAFSIIQLHPYQYIYYNQFTGGVGGASERYELDYWLTFYKEMGDYVDSNIPPKSKIVVYGSENKIKMYTKNNYKIGYQDEISDQFDEFDYIILPRSVRFTENLDYSNLPTVYEIIRDDAVIAVLKKIQ